MIYYDLPIPEDDVYDYQVNINEVLAKLEDMIKNTRKYPKLTTT